MAYTTIDKPSDYFNTKLYTGTEVSGNSITGVGFQPDWIWIKNRTDASNHNLYDSVRGGNGTSYYFLKSNVTNVEGTNTSSLLTIDSDGFTLGDGNEVNGSGDNMVSWNWLAGGTASSNTDGSITSSVSANTTSGFSIVTWTGDGLKSATVGHGLGSELSCIIIKERNGTDWWHNWQKGLSGDSYNVFFNNTEAERSAYSDGHVKKLDNTITFGFDSSTTNVNAVNQSGINNVGYCFAEKKGFSKFGSYTGNGNADGTFVYTGFKPAFVMIKRTNSTESWYIHDNKRDTFNPSDTHLLANSSNAELSISSLAIDLLSNGIKMRSTDTGYNASGSTYIYMAFAENPFTTSTGIPTTAR